MVDVSEERNKTLDFLVRHVAWNILASTALVATLTAAAQDHVAGGQTSADANVQVEDQPARVQTRDEAVEQDAQGYARTFGINIEEARGRILAMQELRAVKSRIQQTYGSRLAGISTQHTPQFQVSVLLTGDAAVPAESISAGGLTVPVVYRTGARSTIQQLRAATKQHHAAILALLPNTQGIGISTKTGEVVVNVNATGAAATAALAVDAELERLTGVPIRIRAVEGTDIDMDVRGGSLLAQVASS